MNGKTTIEEIEATIRCLAQTLRSIVTLETQAAREAGGAIEALARGAEALARADKRRAEAEALRARTAAREALAQAALRAAEAPPGHVARGQLCNYPLPEGGICRQPWGHEGTCPEGEIEEAAPGTCGAKSFYRHSPPCQLPEGHEAQGTDHRAEKNGRSWDWPCRRR